MDAKVNNTDSSVESQELMDYCRAKTSLINAKLKEYLGDEKSPQYLKTMLGKGGYVYDDEAINKTILGPAWSLLEAGGKRLRPILALTVMDALGKDSNSYIEFSVIPEIVHNATLIHDDIEDGSSMRRGKEALHKKYGIDIALNLGDFMFFFPMNAIIETKKLSTDTKIRLQKMYVKSMMKLGVGQGTDLAWHNQIVDISKVTIDNYLQTAFDKTGALTSMSAQIGAIIAGADDGLVSLFGTFGATLGVAFQIRDDLLNLVGSTVSDTKGGIGDDITEGKVSLLVVHLMQVADDKDKKSLVEILRMHTRDPKLINEAISLLNKYKCAEFAEAMSKKLAEEGWAKIDKVLEDSTAKTRLKQLTELIVNRKV